MGSSKKHKEKDKERDREHKHKRRHRSRSPRDRDRSDRDRDRSDRDRDRTERDRDRSERDRRREESKPSSSSRGRGREEDPPSSSKLSSVVNVDPASLHEGGAENLSLSISETNKLRAKLGLKPLEQPRDNDVQDETKPPKQEDVHVPATNMAHIKKTDDLRKKMAEMKEKRRINQLLGKVKKLGDSDSEDDTLAWVRRSRVMEDEKKKAEKQAKILEEMDAEFGIGDLVAEEFNTKKHYSSRDLKGLTVQHDQADFKEGKTVILTLDDKGVLDEDASDVLINVNMIDNEKAKVNVENKKRKPDYNPYDIEQQDEFGMLKEKEILDKYDEEIHGKKKETFALGKGGKYDTEQERRLEEIKSQIKSRGESLVLPKLTVASEFYTSEEMASFKKVKKKPRKLRKKPKAVTADDLLPMTGDGMEDLGGRGQRIKREEGELVERSAPIPGLDLVEDMDLGDDDADGPDADLDGIRVEEENVRSELDAALKKAQRLKQKRDHKDADRRIAESLAPAPSTDMDTEPAANTSSMVLNTMSEFCRIVGDIPTYGRAGTRPEVDDDELLDFEQEPKPDAAMDDDDDEGPVGWQAVQIDERPVEIIEEEKAPLEEEPVVNEGLAVALELAGRKGYLDQESKRNISAPKHTDLAAKNYAIDDKRNDDLDDKYRKRDRYMGGVVSDFKDKSGYKPDVKLEYVDDSGRLMNQKEAFRYLSHRFHGKGSGKRKTEKRQKKVEEEQLMKAMSSTDTPLNTVALLTEKQKTEKTPFIVLSGGGSGKGTTSLVK